MSAPVSSEVPVADETSQIVDAVADTPVTTAAAASAETLDQQTTDSMDAAVEPTAACSELVSATKLATTSTATAPTSSRRSSGVRAAQSAAAVVEEPMYIDEQSQCGECKKSFRNETLLDYHKKYYHHVPTTDSGGVTSRRTSVPPGGTERPSSSRLRSKNKSTCKCSCLHACF